MDVRKKVNLYRRYYNWRKAGCIFIHVPKAAGTSINHALYGRTLGHYTISEIEAQFPRLVEQCFVFSVVRNPYDRLISAYHFAKKGRTVDMGMSNPDQYQIPEFGTFESFVNQWLVKQDLYSVDNVFRPQHLYVCRRENVVVDYLARIESMDDDIHNISKLLGKPLHIGKKNVNKGSESYRDYYSNELSETVYQLYRKDFEIFSYNKAL